jgi:hypothetical protein
MLRSIIHQFCLAQVMKRHEKALGKVRKSGAEGKGLNPG